jgi:hypothetical protein
LLRAERIIDVGHDFASETKSVVVVGDKFEAAEARPAEAAGSDLLEGLDVASSDSDSDHLSDTRVGFLLMFPNLLNQSSHKHR